MNGIYLEGITKKELLNAVRIEVSDHFLILLSTQEAADLLGVNVSSVSRMKAEGRLKDYSKHNEHRKFSAIEVLAIRRSREGKRN